MRNLICSIGIVLALYASLGWSLNNGLGRTPPLGWSTWNYFQQNIDEDILMSIADAFVSTGLAKLGYEYLNLDDGWAVGRYPNGTIQEDPTKFPHGMKYLVDYLHSKGLKFGIYTARGATTCLGRPGSLYHEQMDANTYAHWGVDYLKEDSCGNYNPNLDQYSQYAKMRDALNNTGRPIYFSICEFLGTKVTPDTPYGGLFTPFVTRGEAVKGLANSWLVEYVNMYDAWYADVDGGNYGLLSNIDAQLSNWTDPTFSGPGGWNDADMMECCNGGMTDIEYKSHFSIWAILASPIILSSDLRQMTEECMGIIGNQEVIAVHQDALGIQGILVSSAQDLQIFARPLQDGSKAVVLFNRSETNSTISVTWSEIGLSVTTKAMVRDLWTHQNLGVYAGVFSTLVLRHGVVMLRITPKSANSM